MSRRAASSPVQPGTRRSWLATVVALVAVTALAATGGWMSASAQGAQSKHDLHVAHLRFLSSHPRPLQQAREGPSLCGARLGHPGHIKHVVWIVMENRSYPEVIGAPYISTLAARCGVETNYHNITHPSLPNYIALTSGLPMALLPKTDCGGTACMVHAPSIFTQTTSWGVFAESMPGNCVRHDVRPYVAHHTAAPFYFGLAGCATKDVPLTALNLSNLPAFSLIVPNVNNDMHQTSSSVAAGDAWLRVHLGAILASPTYRSGSTVVFVTWDEGGRPDHSKDCAMNTTDNGCHVALLVMSPSIQPGSRWSSLANHYSLLAVTEELLGLPQLGQALLAPDLVAPAA